MNGMTLDEIYEMLKEEDIRYERWRTCNPCCANCKYYYTDYGCDLCKKMDIIPEDITDIYHGKCENWE